MIIKTLRYITVLLTLAVLPATAQEEKDTLFSFLNRNPEAVEFNVIYEGTRLNLSADNHYLLVNFCVAHPALQMRFLMQRFSFYIDPSGKKKKKYEISMPSALEVKDELEAVIPPEGTERSQDTRPDIRPLISALNKKGAEYLYNGQVHHLGYQYFHIEIDSQNDLLTFYVLVPKEPLMNDRKLTDQWTIGIFSMNDFANMPPPEQEYEGGMMPPPMEGEDQQSIQELMQSDIRLWTKFSIDDINNVNLTE